MATSTRTPDARRTGRRLGVGLVAVAVVAAVLALGTGADAAMPASGRFVTAQYADADLTTVADQTYGTATNQNGTTATLRLDLYLPPAGGPALRPLVVLIHGGGFVGGNKSQMTATAKGYARLGYAAASIGYRTDPGADPVADQVRYLTAALNAIDDGMEAVRWLRSKAATYAIDTTRIGAVGSSAGGAIALGIGAHDDPTPGGPLAAWSPKIRAAVSTGGHLTPGIDLGLIDLQATDAPALMFHYATDTVTGHTAAYAKKTCDGLVAAGSRCTFVPQSGSGHTVSLAAGGTRWTSPLGPFLWDELGLDTVGTPTSTTTTAATTSTSTTGSTSTSTTASTSTTSTSTTTTVPSGCTPDLVPFASADALVRQQYLDVVGRAATSTERAAATAVLTACTGTADELIESLLPTAQTTTDARLVRLYHAFFERAPDPSGFAHWSSQLAAGRGLVVVAQRFAESTEFRSTYGSLSNAAFVELVYVNVLGRPSEPGGKASWVGRLDRRTSTRGQVMVGFSESSENVRTKTPLVQVWRALRSMGQRLPSTAHLLPLAEPVLAGTDALVEAIATIRHHPDYAARF